MNSEFRMENTTVERAVKKSKRSIGNTSKSMMTTASGLTLISKPTGGPAVNNITTGPAPPPSATIFSTSTDKIHNLNINFELQIAALANTSSPSEVSFDVPLGTFKNPDTSKQSFEMTIRDKTKTNTQTLDKCLIQNIVNNTATNKSKVTFNIGTLLNTTNSVTLLNNKNILCTIKGNYVSL